ncbi:MAG: methionine adenosyltransferase [Ruminococcaceae bacterium]|nr:methionine adenosyltransferase [Oscillospiraceae bacterium]
MALQKLFTSESVTEGHPDKLCDQVSDGVLDAVLAQDPMARVACETCTTTGVVMVMGEMTTNTYVDVEQIVRDTVKKIGYDGSGDSFDYKTCAVLTAIHGQSPDIAMGVDSALENREGGKDAYDLIGAGDQGMMFGYACRETKELMPAPITFAHELTRKLAEVRKNGRVPFILPDGKSQVSVIYDENGNPERFDNIVISTQHLASASLEQIREAVIEEVIYQAVPMRMIDKNTKIYVNPTGRFVIGGPQGDSGLTGRKIIVDTYGGYARHGGGAFSGKDPTKVDRTGAYYSRYIAKNLVAAGLADKCELQLAYAIGVAQPVSVLVDSFGTGKLDDLKLAEIVRKHFDMRPAAMIEQLNLRKPVYQQVAAYGHMGRPDLDLTWERTDRAEELKAYLG